MHRPHTATRVTLSDVFRVALMAFAQANTIQQLPIGNRPHSTRKAFRPKKQRRRRERL